MSCLQRCPRVAKPLLNSGMGLQPYREMPRAKEFQWSGESCLARASRSLGPGARADIMTGKRGTNSARHASKDVPQFAPNPGQIQVSDEAHERLKDDFNFERRGLVDIKEKGEMQTWFLISRKSSVAVVDPEVLA